VRNNYLKVTAMRTKYYIDTEGQDNQAMEEALFHSKTLLDKDNEIERIVFLILTKKHTSRLEEYYGDRKVINQLFIGKEFDGFNTWFKIETIKTYKHYSHGNSVDIVICLGLSDIELFTVSKNESAKYMIAIPSLRKNIDGWVFAERALNLRRHID